MSVTSQHNDEVSAYTQQGSKQPQLHASDAEAILFQFPPTTQPPEGPQPGVTPLQQPHLGQPHAPSAPFAMQNVAFSHEPPYAPQEQMYTNHVRMGSVPVQSGAETADDKRRKGSAVTASNDRELREMLAKNEGRPLRDVAQEVIQKERTPMAEKTKQLFAMLWYVPNAPSYAVRVLTEPGFARCANQQKPPSPEIESTLNMRAAVGQNA